MTDRLRNIDRQVMLAVLMVVVAAAAGYTFFLKGPMSDKATLSAKVALGSDSAGNPPVNVVTADDKTKAAGIIAAPTPAVSSIKKTVKQITTGKGRAGAKKIDPIKISVRYKKSYKDSVVVDLKGTFPSIAAFVTEMTSGANFEAGQLRAQNQLFRVSGLKIQIDNTGASAKNVKIKLVTPQ